MFLRQHGKQVFLLHSYRDGERKVRHRCLGRFRPGDDFQRHWEHLHQALPEWRRRLEELRPTAEEMLKAAPPPLSDDQKPLRQATHTLLRLLSRLSLEDPQVQAAIAPLQARLRTGPYQGETLEEVLQDRVERHGSKVSPSRDRLDPAEPDTGPYLQALLDQARHLYEQGKRTEALLCLKQRVELCPNLEALSLQAYWQDQDRQQDAIQPLLRLGEGDAERNFNLAALYFGSHRYVEGCQALMKGLAQKPGVLKALERGDATDGYWNRYGYLWGEEARRFLLQLGNQSGVRHRLRGVTCLGKRPRTLIHPYYQRQLLVRVAGDLGIQLPPMEPWGCRPGSASWVIQTSG